MVHSEPSNTGRFHREATSKIESCLFCRTIIILSNTDEIQIYFLRILCEQHNYFWKSLNNHYTATCTIHCTDTMNLTFEAHVKHNFELLWQLYSYLCFVSEWVSKSVPVYKYERKNDFWILRSFRHFISVKTKRQKRERNILGSFSFFLMFLERKLSKNIIHHFSEDF